MKTGVIDVGGGMRGIYGAGVFDRCLEMGIIFDCCIGVSAGAANTISYLAGQRGRNYRFYMDYSFRPEYMGLHSLAMTGSYINLDYIYGDLSVKQGEDPLDFEKAQEEFAKGRKLIIVATDAETGEPVYFDNRHLKQDSYSVVCASSCVPIVNRPYSIDGRSYYDGGVSDPIPVEKAFEIGCDRVVVVLTKPRDYYRETNDDLAVVRLLELKHPAVARAMKRRGDVYNFYLDKCKDYEKEGKVLIIAPDDIGEMKTLTRRKADMEMMYREGLKDGAKINDWL